MEENLNPPDPIKPMKVERADGVSTFMELAKMLVRYELPAETGWDELTEILRGRDPNVNLALAMLACRMDFSRQDGIADALQHCPDTPEERMLYQDIRETLEHYDGDGRSFRDYDRVLRLADPVLAQDAMTAFEHSSRW